MLISKDKTTEINNLAPIEEFTPDQAELKRQLMYTFEDLVLADPNRMQVILKEIPRNEMVMALKTTSDAVKEHIFRNISERASDTVNDDSGILSPVRVADAALALQQIVKAVRKPEDEGENHHLQLL